MHGYPINLQGHHYFVTRVMPQVRRRANDFSLEVVGNGCNAVPPGDGVLLTGFVEDLRAVYARARFLVMPVFGVTGQQIRIVEAMANGLPVVALRAAAEASPIRHGFNGLVADNAAEFAEHVLRLWREPETCRKMGAAARATIATEFSRERLLSSLAAILS